MPVVDLSAARWRKSSRSSNAGSNDACVEVAFENAQWRKSSRSSNAGSNDNCVEVAFVEPAVAVRDSKAPDSGALVFSSGTWRRFRAGLPS